jgi:hypothetical protein
MASSFYVILLAISHRSRSPICPAQIFGERGNLFSRELDKVDWVPFREMGVDTPREIDYSDIKFK